MRTEASRPNSIGKDLLYGAIGGAIGTLVLEQMGNLLYGFENEEKRRQEESLRKEAPPMAASRHLSKTLDLHLSEKAMSGLAQAIHWGTGISFGMLYAVLHDRFPIVSRAAGLPYGLTFALLVDEGLNTAFKLTPSPQKFPIEAHLRGLATHVAFAASADGVYHLMRKILG